MCNVLVHDDMFSITLYVSLQFTIYGLCDAARHGNLEDVKSHIKAGVDVNGKGWVSLYVHCVLCVLLTCKKDTDNSTMYSCPYNICS